MVFHRNAKLGLAGGLALVQAIEGGMSMRAAAAAFSVSPATAHRWWHRWVRGGRSRRARALLVCLIAPADLAAARASSPRSCRSGSAPAAGRRAGGLAGAGNSRTNSSTPARTASRTRVGSARALVNAQDDQAPHAPVAGAQPALVVAEEPNRDTSQTAPFLPDRTMQMDRPRFRSNRAATTPKPPTRRDSPMWPPHYCRPLAQHQLQERTKRP